MLTRWLLNRLNVNTLWCQTPFGFKGTSLSGSQFRSTFSDTLWFNCKTNSPCFSFYSVGSRLWQRWDYWSNYSHYSWHRNRFWLEREASKSAVVYFEFCQCLNGILIFFLPFCPPPPQTMTVLFTMVSVSVVDPPHRKHLGV